MPVPFDRRVWQEARTLNEAGYEVSVICPTGKDHTRLRETIEIIRGGMKQGLSADDLVAAGLPAQYAAIGERPRFVSEERWIRFVYGYYSARD